MNNRYLTGLVPLETGIKLGIRLGIEQIKEILSRIQQDYL